MTRFVNWFPYPRFMNMESWQMRGGMVSAWDDHRGMNAFVQQDDVTAYFMCPNFTLPVGETLNLVATIELRGSPNIEWGYQLAVTDASGSPVSIITSAGTHLSTRFTVPDLSSFKIQGVCPKGDGNWMKVSDVSIVSDDGLAWMRENDEWWIHGQLMPLRS